jgi:large subunit ribosomal protein L5
MSLKETYKSEVIPKLKEAFGYENPHAVPTIRKVTINAGLGEGVRDSEHLETTEQTLRRITGQKPVKTRARKSISSFNIRQGDVIGMQVTLRGKRMWDFLEKLIKVTFPRVRDFRGLEEDATDGQGNYAIGFPEHMAFPEISSDEIEVVHGLQVNIDTTAETDKECIKLLKDLGFPFKKEESENS